MNTTDIRTLIGYTDWANQRVLDQAMQLSPDQLLAPDPVPMHSLLGTLAHVLVAEVIWRRRWEGEWPVVVDDIEGYLSIDVLVERWQNETAALHAFVANLTDQDLQRTVHYRNSKGTPFQQVLWQLIIHVVNHGTQHRSEAAMLLTNAGHSPGELDMILYLREQQG